MDSFGSVLAALIQSRKNSEGKPLTATRLGVECGWSKSKVSDWTNNKHPPDRDDIARLVAYFGLTGREKKRFENLAAIAHMPEPFQSRFLELSQGAKLARDLAPKAVDMEKRILSAEKRALHAEKALSDLRNRVQVVLDRFK